MKEYTIGELSRSRLLYDRNPPPLMLITAAIIIALVAGMLVWACVTEKTEVVNAAGIVSVEDVEYHSSTVAGMIASIEVEEGSPVGVGDPVIRLDTGELEKQLEAYSSLESLYLTYSDGYSKAIESLQSFDASSAVGSCESNRNPFCSEDLLYSTYQVYLDSISRVESEHSSAASLAEAVEETVNQALRDLYSAKIQYEASYSQYSAQEKYFKGLDEDYAKAIDALTAYAVEGPVPSNPFSSGDAPYLSFRNVLDALNAAADDDSRSAIRDAALEDYCSLRAQNAPSLSLYSSQASFYEALVSEYSDMIFELRGFDASSKPGSSSSNSNPYPSGDRRHPIYQAILDSIDSVHREHSSEASLKESRQRIVSQALAELSSAKSQYDVQYTQSRSQADIYRKMIEDSEFRAGSEGIVHIMSGLEVGTMVSSGQALFTVSPELNAETCTITVYLPSASRAHVSVGDDVRVTFEGIDGNEYGTIRGELVSIGADSTRDSAGNVIYECVVKPDSVRFQDRTGKIVEAVQGMTAKVSIHYEQTTWIEWAKHLLGLDRYGKIHAREAA